MTDLNFYLTRLVGWGRFIGLLSRPREYQLVGQALLRRQTRPAPPEIAASLADVRGWLSLREAGLLYRLARTWPVAGPVVELGSYAGRSAIVFARAGREVHSVDAWSLEVVDGRDYGDASMDTVMEEYLRNVAAAGIADRVRVHRGYTHAIGRTWTIPAALLFIDAGHTYADVRADLDLWTPHLLPGGLLLMHDVLMHGFTGVVQAAAELLGEGWRVAASSGSIVAFERARR